MTLYSPEIIDQITRRGVHEIISRDEFVRMLQEGKPLRLKMGFDPSLTAGGMMDLLRDAWEVLPGIYDLPMVETWVGFRPASRDDAPILGVTAMAGLMLASGHHRNGILLAPITAEAVAQQVLTGRPLPGTECFGIDRFCIDRLGPGEVAAPRPRGNFIGPAIRRRWPGGASVRIAVTR